ncbi:thiolase family protein [archaeon]|nr:MAG: thiolase family protein [archaeon]
MSVAQKAVFIVGAKRTPFGAFGGKLKQIGATDLASLSAKAALAQANVTPDKVDETFFGNVIGSSLDSAYLARHASLKAGVPIKSPAMNINRLCGSGFETVCLGAEAILLGRSKINLCGGTENMSQAPMQIDGLSARWGAALGKGLHAEDALWAGLTDSYAKLPMGLTAEKLGAQYGITREQCDEFGLRSQQLYAAAHAKGIFKAEIGEVEVKGKKGMEKVADDEHPRPKSALGDLQKLKPVFKENGLVTAGTASGICDGAGTLVLADEGSVKSQNLKPLSRVVAWSRVGCDPSIMGIGPVEAIRNVLKATNLTLNDIDLIEINEAFAAQYLACEKELGLDRNKCNTNGGAIAVGHPLGASGSRILAHLTHEMIRLNKKYSIGSACIGGGQGIAVLLENVSK